MCGAEDLAQSSEIPELEISYLQQYPYSRSSLNFLNFPRTYRYSIITDDKISNYFSNIYNYKLKIINIGTRKEREV